MNSIFAVLCFFVMLAAIVTSCRKLRTIAYGFLTCAVTLAACFALTVGFQLDEVIMANAFVSIMLVVSGYTMWTHSRMAIRETLAKTYRAAAETTPQPPTSTFSTLT
jgi:hypothetical protein